MNNLRNLQWRVVAFALVLTLGATLGAMYLFRLRTESAPLQKFYASQPEVRQAEISLDGDRYVIALTLNSVADFRDAYTRLDAGTQQVLKDRKAYKLAIKDERNATLMEDYYKLHFDLETGVATGEFSRMADQFNSKAAALGLDQYKVWVDGDRLYVQLQGHGGYLYEVLPRAAEANRTAGGEQA